MARRIRVERLIAIMGALVLALGALIVVGASRGERFGFAEPSREARALEQVRSRLGPAGELRYVERGRGRVLCGYAGVRGEAEAIGFVSRPNRILFSTDPLVREFERQLTTECPGFNRRPAP